jgi:hypothetical protein
MTFINGAITDRSQFAVAVESSTPGTLPGSPEWKYLEVNSVTSFGETIGTTAREPISGDRMRRKGSITSLDSSVGFEADLTFDLFSTFAEGLFFANWAYEQTSFTPTAVTTTGYTVASGGDLAADTLVYARNYANNTNNGLKRTTTSTVATEIEVTDTLVAETSPPSSARVDIVGVQGASGDLSMDSDGNLNSTPTTGLDFTTLNIEVGQWIYVGGSDTDTYFATAGVGEARVQSVTTNQIVFDKKPSGFTTDAGTGKTIQLFIGSFIKNVEYADADFATTTYTFEAVYEGLTNKYQYPNGNYFNELTIDMNMEDKATCSLNFVGLDTPVPTSSRESGTWSYPVDTTMLNTTSDFAALEMKTSDGTSIVDTGEALFQDLSVTISNNITPKKGLGTLGAVMVALGNFNVDISATMYFDSSQPLVSIRDNDTVSLNWTLQNEDGGIHFDIPSMTLGDGTKSFPTNDTINLSISGTAFKDSFYDNAFTATSYPYLPL